MGADASDPHDHAGRGHSHSHGPRLAAAQPGTRAGARYAKRLAVAFVVVAVLFVVEAIVGFATGSLALLSDAGHMLTDVLGLGLSLAAISVASRHGRGRTETFGVYRLEILAALANAVLLFAVAGYVIVEAVRRLDNAPELAAPTVLVAAIAGLIANIVAFLLLRKGAEESINVRGAYLEVLADLVGSVAVIVSAAIVAVTEWWWVDPIAGALLGVWILPRTWRLAREALRVLLQAPPPHLDLDALRHDLGGLPGVVDVHDLHVWTLTSDMEVASAHLMVTAGADNHAVLDQARHLLAERYGVDHATLQVEPDDHTGCDEVTW